MDAPLPTIAESERLLGPELVAAARALADDHPPTAEQIRLLRAVFADTGAPAAGNAA